MSTRYFIEISYNGTNYHGWQNQPNAVTVQQILENALTLLLREKIEATGCGRTDTGVHAVNFIAHFDSANPNMDTNSIIMNQLNSILPKDIAVSNIIRVIPEAHARYDAISRTYQYKINLKKDPFKDNLAYYYRHNLDMEKMAEASSILLNHSDFKSFTKLHSDNKTTICHILQADWTLENNEMVFTIKADRFLRSMVRTIVGTLLKVGSGKISVAEFNEIIEAKDRSRAASAAPPTGLYLTQICYPQNIYEVKTTKT